MPRRRAYPPVRWRLHLASPCATVFALLATDAGRARFWAERSASDRDAGTFALQFIGGESVRCRVLECMPSRRFAFTYFAGTRVTITLASDRRGGTDVTLVERGFPSAAHRAENRAGWLQVLLCLKAAADYGVDLRNHDRRRTWMQGYCEN